MTERDTTKRRRTISLFEDQDAWLVIEAERLRVDVSDVLRMLVEEARRDQAQQATAVESR